MKCLVISGSPATNYIWNNEKATSYTYRLVEEVKDALSQQGEVEFLEVRLSDVNLPYCKGCYACFQKGESSCPHKSLVQPIMKSLEESDCLILASPVYALHASALIKGFFDLTAYNFHRPRFFEKKALVIGSTAGAGVKNTCEYMKSVLQHWGFNKVYTLPVTRYGANEVSGRLKRRCHRAADRLCEDVVTGKLYSPGFRRLFYQQFWRAMSLVGNAVPADYIYWQESGLARRVFAEEIPLGAVKKAFGSVLFWILHKVMR